MSTVALEGLVARAVASLGDAVLHGEDGVAAGELPLAVGAVAGKAVADLDGENAFLTAVNVVIVPLIAYLVYKRKVDRYETIGAIITLIGIGFLSLQGSMTINIGDALSLACAVAFAFDIFYTNHFVKKEDALSLTIVQFITASFIAIIAVLIQGDIPTTFEKEALYSIIYLAVFSTTIAYVCQNVAFQYTTATKGAIILSLESFFGMLLSVLFLHEVLTGRMIIGAALIMIAILITELKPSFHRKHIVKIHKKGTHAELNSEWVPYSYIYNCRICFKTGVMSPTLLSLVIELFIDKSFDFFFWHG